MQKLATVKCLRSSETIRGKAQRNRFRIGARSYDEVVFESTCIAVINQVNSGVDVRIFHPAVIGNVFAPRPGIISQKVVALPRYFFKPADERVRISTR